MRPVGCFISPSVYSNWDEPRRCTAGPCRCTSVTSSTGVVLVYLPPHPGSPLTSDCFLLSVCVSVFLVGADPLENVLGLCRLAGAVCRCPHLTLVLLQLANGDWNEQLDGVLATVSSKVDKVGQVFRNA